MNGSQIENILQLIDSNVQMTQSEAVEYIRDHQAEIVRQLATTGTATVRTNAGNLQLNVADLEAVAV